MKNQSKSRSVWLFLFGGAVISNVIPIVVILFVGICSGASDMKNFLFRLPVYIPIYSIPGLIAGASAYLWCRREGKNGRENGA